MRDAALDVKAQNSFVESFRSSSPYINAHRGRTFVLLFGGEAVADPNFPKLVHDVALLSSLGVRLVLVHGARPQIEHRLTARGASLRYQNGLRITDDEALQCVKEAVAQVRVEIEALLSMGLANTPMAGAEIRVVSGNFVTARPLGVREGVDYRYTGEVRRIAAAAIQTHLGQGEMVLLSPLGYSPTGEVFNLSAEEVATQAAVRLKADKLIYLVEGTGLARLGEEAVRELTPAEGEQVLRSSAQLSEHLARALSGAVKACRAGVRRSHLIGRSTDGALLLELFTRDGIGTLVTEESYETLRPATIEDVGGILALIAPLERDGSLIRRSRELLEMEIDRFSVVERDGMIVGSAALYPFPDEHLAEVACVAVSPDYRGRGRGDQLLKDMEAKGRRLGLQRLFVLTTRTAQWFQERGFQLATLDELPVERKALYNYQRNSKVLIKSLRP